MTNAPVIDPVIGLVMESTNPTEREAAARRLRCRSVLNRTLALVFAVLVIVNIVVWVVYTAHYASEDDHYPWPAWVSLSTGFGFLILATSLLPVTRVIGGWRLFFFILVGDLVIINIYLWGVYLLHKNVDLHDEFNGCRHLAPELSTLVANGCVPWPIWANVGSLLASICFCAVPAVFRPIKVSENQINKEMARS